MRPLLGANCYRPARKGCESPFFVDAVPSSMRGGRSTSGKIRFFILDSLMTVLPACWCLW